MLDCVFEVFFFKQKTAYELRIMDWSSDVCSSDLRELKRQVSQHARPLGSTASSKRCRELPATRSTWRKADLPASPIALGTSGLPASWTMSALQGLKDCCGVMVSI